MKVHLEIILVHTKLNRIARFYIAGGINTLISYIIYAALIYVGFVYWLAVIFCYILGLIVNYKTIKLIAFSDSRKQSFSNFCLIFFGTCILNITSLKVLIELGVNQYLAAWIVVIPVSLLSYLLNKKFVFNQK